MKKRFCALLAFLMLLSGVLFSGCGGKAAPTPEKFRKLMKSNALAVSDITSADENELIVKHLVATDDFITVNFIVLRDEANAKAFYEELSAGFEAQLDGKRKDKDDHAFYVGKNEDSVFYVAFKHNTTMVARAEIGSHKTTDKIFRKLHMR